NQGRSQMAHKEQITKAIGAHGLWKAKLSHAIKTGEIDKTVDEIRKDNCCEFGQWLYGSTLSAEDKNSDFYKDVKALHTQFHSLAADIADLATKNKRTEAEQKMEGDYKLVSSDLTRKLMAWMSAA